MQAEGSKSASACIQLMVMISGPGGHFQSEQGATLKREQGGHFASEFPAVNVALSAGDVDAVYGDIHYVNDGELDKSVRYYSSASFRRERMMQGWMPAHPSFYCRREIYLKYGLFDTSFKVAADFEQLLRLIYVEGIRLRYIPKDFVTMRTGGASTAGLKARMTIMKEHLRGFKKNGIKNNVFRLSTRYFSKLWEYFRKP